MRSLLRVWCWIVGHRFNGLRLHGTITVIDGKVVTDDRGRWRVECSRCGKEQPDA